MADEIEIEGVQYISSKRAAEMSGYAQDYIGQLARGGYIDARRIGGLWHVSLASLQEYEKKADNAKAHAPSGQGQVEADSMVSFDGKDYISASRAAHLTSYHQDYVGQLARSCTIPSRQVGNRWYVERDAILAHKTEKDRLLGAVQSESVGIARVLVPVEEKRGTDGVQDESRSYFRYTKDEANLLPDTPDSQNDRFARKDNRIYGLEESELKAKEVRDEDHTVPIHVVREEKILDHSDHVKYVKSEVPRSRKTIFYWTFGVAMLAVIIALPVTFFRIKSTFVKGGAASSWANTSALSASAASAFTAMGDLLERFLVPELIYKSTQ